MLGCFPLTLGFSANLTEHLVTQLSSSGQFLAVSFSVVCMHAVTLAIIIILALAGLRGGRATTLTQDAVQAAELA